MGLSWQQGPLGRNPHGQFLVPVPERVVYAEPLRRRMRAELDGETVWFQVGERDRAAWQHVDAPAILAGKVALAWRAMDAFYEEDDRILGHAADPYHRIDVRHSSRHLVVRSGERVLADTRQPLVMYESGFAPRWYVPREDVLGLEPVEHETFCPYKGVASYYDDRAAWSYVTPFHDMEKIAGHVSFEPDRVEVTLDGERLLAEPGQTVVAHGIDRDLTYDRAGER